MDLLSIMSFLNDERALSVGATRLNVAGQIVGGIQTMQAGRDAKRSAGFQAAQLVHNAGQTRAAAQHTAEDIERQNRLVASRALAVAAASGGGASDPTVINLIARNAAEGAYKREVALYGGEAQANAMELQADAAEYSGASARRAAMVTGIMQATVGAGAAYVSGRARTARIDAQRKAIDPQSRSMREKYGGDGPKTMWDQAPSSIWFG